MEHNHNSDVSVLNNYYTITNAHNNRSNKNVKYQNNKNNKTKKITNQAIANRTKKENHAQAELNKPMTFSKLFRKPKYKAIIAAKKSREKENYVRSYKAQMKDYSNLNKTYKKLEQTRKNTRLKYQTDKEAFYKNPNIYIKNNFEFVNMILESIQNIGMQYNNIEGKEDYHGNTKIKVYSKKNGTNIISTFTLVRNPPYNPHANCPGTQYFILPNAPSDFKDNILKSFSYCYKINKIIKQIEPLASNQTITLPEYKKSAKSTTTNA
uniref:Uncharacterized protein n=1 Tax=viral metagenome TaxID=1070528 RepID=A0A6C0HLQ2_9ZZZZ